MRSCFVFLGEAPRAPALTGVKAWAMLTCQNCGTPALLLSAHKVLFPIWIMVLEEKQEQKVPELH